MIALARRQAQQHVLRIAGALLAKGIPPATVAYWTARGTQDPSAAARSATVRLGSLLTPTPADVVARYIDGQVLFGTSSPSPHPFEWESYAQRAVTTTAGVHIPKRLPALQRRLGFETRFDQDLEQILDGTRRSTGTWITDGIVDLYVQLAAMGLVACVGTYRDDELVGGLWGLQIGRTLGIMSVFHRVDHAGTIAQLAVFEALAAGRRWDLVESGLPNEHYARFGAVAVTASQLSASIVQGLGARPAAARQPEAPGH